jgi:hypothetical protein
MELECITLRKHSKMLWLSTGINIAKVILKHKEGKKLKKVLRKEEVWFSIKSAVCGCCGNKTDVIYLEGERNLTKGELGLSNTFSSPLVCLNCMKRIQNMIKEELNIVMLQKKANSGGKDGLEADVEIEEDLEELDQEV